MSDAMVNTVTGAIPVSELGCTLMHEHLVIGYPGWEADTLRPGPSRDQMLSIFKSWLRMPMGRLWIELRSVRLTHGKLRLAVPIFASEHG